MTDVDNSRSIFFTTDFFWFLLTKKIKKFENSSKYIKNSKFRTLLKHNSRNGFDIFSSDAKKNSGTAGWLYVD